MFDIHVFNAGSVVILTGKTPEGRDWLEANLDADASRWCGGFAVEPRYVGAILDGADSDGLSID
jgi:hypothetical protein